MNLGHLCQIILKFDEEISGYGQLAQHVIFAYHMVRQTPLIALSPLRFLGLDQVVGDELKSLLLSESESRVTVLYTIVRSAYYNYELIHDLKYS